MEMSLGCLYTLYLSVVMLAVSMLWCTEDLPPNRSLSTAGPHLVNSTIERTNILSIFRGVYRKINQAVDRHIDCMSCVN